MSLPVSAGAPALTASTRGLVGWVCTSNPFYVLSALLVWLGLWVSFGAQAQAAETWALMAGMAGYTALLAVTACLLVRLVGVWDDVRTVMLLVVLMLLATSVTFDEVLAREPGRGIACYLAGLAFAVAVSEGMLRGSRLALPALFRVPYYLILALFFLYPVALTPLLDRPHDEALAWALFGFSPVAGLVALTLLPAIRRGRHYTRDNGSPWPWAWYPWTLFGVLGFAVLARSALLAWSMHHVEQSATEPYIFGAYFLVPFLLCSGVLLLEVARFERHRGTLVAAMLMPAALALLASVGHRPEPFYQWFLARFTARLGGTPLYLTLIASAGFYAYAASRRVPLAIEALSAVLVVLAFVDSGTLGLDELAAPHPLPLLAVAALQLGFGLLRRDSWRCLLGVACVVVAALVGEVGTGVLPHRLPIAFHLGLVAALVLGAVFDDALGWFLRGVGAAMALLACLAVTTGSAGGLDDIPTWAVRVYPPAISALVAGYGLWLGHRPSLVIAAVALCGWLLSFGWWGYRTLREVVTGLDYIAVGLVCFALAILVSVGKGGLLPWRFDQGKAKAPGPAD